MLLLRFRARRSAGGGRKVSVRYFVTGWMRLSQLEMPMTSR